MNRVDLDRVLEVQKQGAQLVEVLPRKQFEEQHLPGAISLPLSKFSASELAKLDKDRPVIVYCWDYQWDLSRRAAARLEAEGFKEIYDYVTGKADWLSMGMPSEGTGANATIKSVLREVPVCKLEDAITAVKSKVTDDWDISVVIDRNRVVLGLLELSAIQDNPAIKDVMKPAPLTLRPMVSIADAIARFDKSNITFALVTKSTGELMGGIRKKDLSTS